VINAAAEKLVVQYDTRNMLCCAVGVSAVQSCIRANSRSPLETYTCRNRAAGTHRVGMQEIKKVRTALILTRLTVIVLGVQGRGQRVR